MLFVARGSLEARRDDWIKVVKAWFMVVDFVADPSHEGEALAIMARRVRLPAPSYAKLMSGTRLLGGEENRRRFHATAGLDSVAGSSETVDRFNLRNHVYRDTVAVGPYFDSSLVEEALAQPGVRAPR